MIPRNAEPAEDRYAGPWRCALCGLLCRNKREAYDHAALPTCHGGLLSLVPVRG